MLVDGIRKAPAQSPRPFLETPACPKSKTLNPWTLNALYPQLQNPKPQARNAICSTTQTNPCRSPQRTPCSKSSSSHYSTSCRKPFSAPLEDLKENLKRDYLAGNSEQLLSVAAGSDPRELRWQTTQLGNLQQVFSFTGVWRVL